MGKVSCDNCRLMKPEESLVEYRGQTICPDCLDYYEPKVEHPPKDFFPKEDNPEPEEPKSFGNYLGILLALLLLGAFRSGYHHLPEIKEFFFGKDETSKKPYEVIIDKNMRNFAVKDDPVKERQKELKLNYEREVREEYLKHKESTKTPESFESFRSEYTKKHPYNELFYSSEFLQKLTQEEQQNITETREKILKDYLKNNRQNSSPSNSQ